jgi:hypothetical protein
MKYDVRQLYASLLPDTRGLPYPDANRPAEQSSGAQGYEIAVAESGEAVPAVNAGGSPVLYPFSFFRLDGSKSYTLPNAPLVRVEGRKNIVRSKVAGRDFTVKELVSVEDWTVQIRGVAFNEEITSKAGRQGYPFATLEAMVELFRIGEALRVESRILESYGIGQVVIERFAVPATPGLQGAFFYEIDCSSDTDNDLVIVRNN